MKVRVTETGEELHADFRMPEQAEEFALHVIAVLKGMNDSREVDRESFDGFKVAMGMETQALGYVGPAIEIRRIPEGN